MKKKRSVAVGWHVRSLLQCLSAVVVSLCLPFTGTSMKASSAQQTASVRLNSTTILRGQTGTVTVDLIALGGANRENAVSFSVVFDTTQLSFVSVAAGPSVSGFFAQTSQVGSGRLGILASRSIDLAFDAGTNQIVSISFQALPTATLASSPITFGDLPIPRQLADVNASLLPAEWLNGTVTISDGFEADVAPRPNGSGTVAVSDWVQVGRFSVGLDTAASGSEFQRADCAPRATLGDGHITVSDWVQAGRYSVGLDALSLAGGPTSLAAAALPEPHSGEARVVRAVNTEFKPGEIGTVEVELDAVGNENAVAFTLNYDAGKATFVDAIIEDDGATDAKLLVNAKHAGQGRVAIAVALPSGRTFLSGKRRLVSLRFGPRQGEAPALMEVGFDDSLTRREVVTANAERLSHVTYAGAAVKIEANTLATISTDSHRAR